MRPFGVVTKQGRFVRNDVLNQYATKSESRRLKDNFGADYGAEKLIQPLYNPESLAKLLEINTYHYRAVKTKARDTAGLGWSIAPSEGTEDEGSGELPSDVVALQRFFDELTPPLPLILDRAQTDYEAVGWACLELVRDDYATEGPYVDMEHVPSHTIRLHRDNIRVLQKRGNKKRWFKLVGSAFDVNADTGDVKPLGELEKEKRATELLYWTNYTPRSDFYGLPDIMPALGAIQGEIARRDYNIAFFDNFGVPAYAVFITGNFDVGDPVTDSDGVERTPLELAIEEHFQELTKNPHSTLILAIPGTDVKVEFKPLATDVKEASFRMYRMDNRDEVLAAHGVPPYRAGIAETGSLGGSTARETTEIYKRSVIEPRQSTIEHMFNRYIVREAFGVTSHEFKLDQIDTTDESHDMGIVERLFNMRAIDASEVRAIFAKRFGIDPEAPPDQSLVRPIPTGATVPSDVENAPLEVLESAVEQMYERVMKSRKEAGERLRLVQG